MSEEIIEESVKEFIEEYFSEIKQVSHFHLQFFYQNSIDTTDINMLALKDIIFRALNFLQNIDERFFSKLLRKMYFDVSHLIRFLNNFEKNSNLNQIFESKFLNKFPSYKKINNQIELAKSREHSQRTIMLATENELKYLKPKSKAEINAYNKLRGRSVDAIHKYQQAKENIQKLNIQLKELKSSLNKQFVTEFQKIYNIYLNDLILVINSKLFYFNKLIWKEASKSTDIKNYFNSLGIKNFDLNTYAKSYIKNMNASKNNNIEELEIIEEALRELK